MKILNVILFYFAILVNLYSQPFIFFSDSPSNDYYDPSWGFANPPSFVELSGLQENKFPVSTQFLFSGINSLKLNWQSVSGGDWALALAEIGWIAHDISSKDSLIIYLFTTSDILSSNLPKIYLEDLNGQKTEKQNLGDYTSNLISGSWKKASIPLSDFVSNPGLADVTKIKTIFFGQNVNDGINHTLFIDEVRMIEKSDSNEAGIPTIPQNVIAKGYDSHIDIMWDLNSEKDIEKYIIYRKEDNNFVPIGTSGKYDRFFSDFVGQHGVTYYYKVSAQDENLNNSDLSEEVFATTYEMSDDELLTMVQEATFRYFWDYAHPFSGLSRERYNRNGGNTVTSGGSGFGIMAILVGIEREFITREEGAERILMISKFLRDNAERFQGVWSHWLNGETGQVIPFSQYDNGGDLVETSFLIQGLLTARKYFNKPNPKELEIGNVITELWESVDWNFYRKFNHSPYLYWHWSPTDGWIMNFRLVGYMETLITYVLAVASPTYGIPGWCYENGWVENKDNYISGKTYYDYKLYVGRNLGGPLFFAHYSFLGFDPRFVKDKYANYFLHNRNQTLINRAYCIENPEGYVGYDENTWGLTASDNPWGYSAQEPKINDNGTITPTAAVSSMPYTPDESMAALKNFYRNYGEYLWGIYGFKDAFNPTENWFAQSYLAIDQGPIICMIENHRSQLLWNYFMQNEEIQSALDSIGFVEDLTNIYVNEPVTTEFQLKQNYPNPFNPSTTISYSIPNNALISNSQSGERSQNNGLGIPNHNSTSSVNVRDDNINVSLKIYDVLGKEVATLVNQKQKSGNYEIMWDGKSDSGAKVPSGVYFYQLTAGTSASRIITETQKMLLVK